MIVGPTGAATMVIDRTWVSDSDNESVTFTVKLAVPVPVGVPEITRRTQGEICRERSKA